MTSWHLDLLESSGINRFKSYKKKFQWVNESLSSEGSIKWQDSVGNEICQEFQERVVLHFTTSIVGLDAEHALIQLHFVFLLKNRQSSTDQFDHGVRIFWLVLSRNGEHNGIAVNDDAGDVGSGPLHRGKVLGAVNRTTRIGEFSLIHGVDDQTNFASLSSAQAPQFPIHTSVLILVAEVRHIKLMLTLPRT